MRKIQIIVTLLLLGRVIAESPTDINQPKFDLDQIEKAYVISLRYDNIGVVESALYCVVKLQHKFPHREFRRIKEVVDDLSINDKTPLICYKANVVRLYLDSQTLLKRLNRENFEDGPNFWAMLVKNIQSLSHDHIQANSGSKAVYYLDE